MTTQPVASAIRIPPAAQATHLHKAFENYVQACLEGSAEEGVCLKELQGHFCACKGILEPEFAEFLKGICEETDPVVELPVESFWNSVFPLYGQQVVIGVECQGKDSRLLSAFALRCFAGPASKALLPLFEKGKEISFVVKFGLRVVYEAHGLNIYSLFFITHPLHFNDEEKISLALTPFSTNFSRFLIRPLVLIIQKEPDHLPPFYHYLREVIFKSLLETMEDIEIFAQRLCFDLQIMGSILPCHREWIGTFAGGCSLELQLMIFGCLELPDSKEKTLSYKDYETILSKSVPVVPQLKPPPPPPPPRLDLSAARLEHQVRAPDRIETTLRELFRFSTSFDVSDGCYAWVRKDDYYEAYSGALELVQEVSPYQPFLLALKGERPLIFNFEDNPFLQTVFPGIRGKFTPQVFLEKGRVHIPHEVLTRFVFQPLSGLPLDPLMRTFFPNESITFFRLSLQSLDSRDEVIEFAHLNQESFYFLFQKLQEERFKGPKGRFRLLWALMPVVCMRKNITNKFHPALYFKEKYYDPKQPPGSLSDYLSYVMELKYGQKETDDKLTVEFYEGLLAEEFQRQSTVLGQAVEMLREPARPQRVEGFVNLNNSICWLTSLLQALFHLPQFETLLNDKPLPKLVFEILKAKKGGEAVDEKMKQLLQAIQTSGNGDFKGDKITDFNDPATLHEMLFEQLGLTTPALQTVQGFFEDGTEYNESSEHKIGNIAIGTGPHLITALNEYFTEIATAPLKVQGKELKQYVISQQLKSPPPYLAIQVKRTSPFDQTTLAFNPTQEIDLKAYVAAGDARYKLQSYIFYQIQGAHYVTVVEKEGKWILYNDTESKEVKDLEADKACLLFFKKM